jgi:hypothetical protein
MCSAAAGDSPRSSIPEPDSISPPAPTPSPWTPARTPGWAGFATPGVTDRTARAPTWAYPPPHPGARTPPRHRRKRPWTRSPAARCPGASAA